MPDDSREPIATAKFSADEVEHPLRTCVIGAMTFALRAVDSPDTAGWIAFILTCDLALTDPERFGNLARRLIAESEKVNGSRESAEWFWSLFDMAAEALEQATGWDRNAD